MESRIQMIRPLLGVALVWFFSAPVFSQVPLPTVPAAPKGRNIQQETEALLNEVMKHCAQEEYQEALIKLERIKLNVNNKPFGFIMLIEVGCHYNLASFRKAIESSVVFLKEFQYSPATTDVLMILGRSYAALKQDDKALEIFNAVLADGFRSSEFLQAGLLANQIYVRCGKPEEGTKLTNKVRSVVADNEINYEMRNLHLNVGEAWIERKACQEAVGACQMVCGRADILRTLNKLLPPRKAGAP